MGVAVGAGEGVADGTGGGVEVGSVTATVEEVVASGESAAVGDDSSVGGMSVTGAAVAWTTVVGSTVAGGAVAVALGRGVAVSLTAPPQALRPNASSNMLAINKTHRLLVRTDISSQ
jgi:hypothetical protein